LPDTIRMAIGLDGKPTDPYQLRYAVPMKRVGQFGEIFTYVTTTPTALDRVGNLLDMIASRGTFHRGSLPIIELQTDSFASRYGRMVAAAKFGIRGLRIGNLKRSLPKPMMRLATARTRPRPREAAGKRNRTRATRTARRLNYSGCSVSRRHNGI